MKVKNKSPWGHFKNSNEEQTHKESIHYDIEQNALKLVDDDTVMFSKPVVITDNSEMWSGAKYDIPTLDISEYRGTLTADHVDKLSNIMGKVVGLKKVANRKVTIDGIKFASKDNPYADYAKRMMMAGHVTDFSIETMGPWPDDDGIFYNAKLAGLSLVVSGNNKQAHINQIVQATIDNANKNGLNTASFMQALKLPLDKQEVVNDNNIDMKYKLIKNSRAFAISLTYKNSAGEDTKVTIEPNQSVEVPDNDANKGVEGQVTDAQEPAKPEAPKTEVKTEVTTETPANQSVDVNAIVKNAVDAATAQFKTQIDEMKDAFDNGVKEPEFNFKKANTPAINSKYSGMDYFDRHEVQINSAMDFLLSKGLNAEAGHKLNEINKYHLEALKADGKVKNAVTISDFGNFVVSPELLTDIQGFRSNYQGILSKFTFRDTLSLTMGWLTRNGDINMQEVEFCDDGEDGNLKPITEYGATFKQSQLKEVAGVTPVCDAATRFLAVDMLGDIATGYRTDFDRKKAQLLIARLQQAVNESGNEVKYNTGTGGGGANVNALLSFFNAGAEMQEDVMGGLFLLSQASYWELKGRQAQAGINSDSGFNIFLKDTDGTELMFGAPYVIVPNDLLPKLGSNQTRTFQVDGVNVVITEAVFYVDPNTFTGRTSGGLKYDLSTEAAYEENGTVKSAYQRNELVLRGSFFRGGAVLDINKVVGMQAVNFS